MKQAGLVVLLLMLAGCGEDASLDRTLATVESVRGGFALGEAEAQRLGRVSPAQTVRVDAEGLSRLSLDAGAQLLLDAGASLSLLDETTLTLTAGRVFAEVGEGEELVVESSHGWLRASDASLSIRAADGALTTYVVRGEVSYRVGAHRGVARSGEELRLDGEQASATAVTLWDDWTGGLARPGPADTRGPAGVGQLEARVPDEVGQARWPLVMRRLDVQVRIAGDLAITEVEQVFFNPASETVEGLYRIRVPEAAALQRFAVDRNGRMVDGYVREQAQARQAYEAQVYRGSTLDPALLEWVAPGRFQARIYPIHPGETRIVRVRYAEWLAPSGETHTRLYRFPMGGGRSASRIQEASITVDLDEAEAESVRAGMGAAIEEGRVTLRRSDFAPHADFWLELAGQDRGQRAWVAPHQPPPRAPDAVGVPGEADEHDYYYLPLRLPDDLFDDVADEGVDLVVVADVSAATDRAHLELGRAVAEALTAHLDDDDRVAIVTSDLTIRSLEDGASTLGPASADRLEGLLDGLARAPAGGATDLGAAVSEAARLLEGTGRPGAVVYIGDGAPTVGELEADGLLERMARLPEPVRLYAVAVGADANLELLETLTRGGGLALRVEERSSAADAALRLLAHASRPLAQRVEVDLGTGVENTYPRRPVDVVRGEVLEVVGRVVDATPEQVTVRGEIGGQPFERTIAVLTSPTDDATDLRLRWAGERLRQLLLDGALREEVAELGTRYGLITPFTSFYVPSAQELQRFGANALPWIDRPTLLASVDRERNPFLSGPWSLLLGPLLLTGCGGDEVEPAPSAAREDDPSSWTEQALSADDPAPPEEPAEYYEDEAAAEMEEAMPEPEVVAEIPPAPTPAGPPPPVVPAQPAPDNAGFATGSGGLPVTEEPARRPARQLGATVRDGDVLNDRWNADGSESAPHEARHRGVLDDRGDGERAQSSESRSSNVVVTIVTPPGHTRQRCSDASALSLEDRRALFAERLEQAGGPNGWLAVYRQAQRDCELPGLRDRRALLTQILAAAGSVERMVDVYRLFASASSSSEGAPPPPPRGVDLLGPPSHHVGFAFRWERSFLRSMILRRVRSPSDLRVVRNAFGLGDEPDPELVEQLLARATTDTARVRVLRQLSMQYADSFDLKLRLLEALERAGMGPEARRLADRLRADPRSDAGVRTAVGEMFLRMDREDDARRAFSEIVEFAPLDELARRRLGDLYRAHGWFEEAYRQYQTLASIRPDDPGVLLLLAQAAAGTGRVDEALRLEQRLMETAQPGAAAGIARVAQLWTSVRLAKLRAEARAQDDAERLASLDRRLRRTGVLRGAGDLRVTLTWSHPDAQLTLFSAHPDEALARPLDINAEYGLEAFDVAEQEGGAYALEVRRADPDSPTPLTAELILVWHEGREDEVVHVVPLVFADGREQLAWRLVGNELRAL